MSEQGSEEASGWCLGTVTYDRERADRSGPDPEVRVGRQLAAEELARIRSDMALLRAAGGNSAGSALRRAFDELRRLLRACLANWPEAETLPMQSDRHGLQNVTRSFGLAVRAFPGRLADDEPVVERLATGRFSYEFERGAGRSAAYLSVGSQRVVALELFTRLHQRGLEHAFRDLLANEDDIRDAITRLRITVAPLIDGAPVLLRGLDQSQHGPEVQFQMQEIAFGDANVCLMNLASAHRWSEGDSAASQLGDIADGEADSRQSSQPPAGRGIGEMSDTGIHEYATASDADADSAEMLSQQPDAEASEAEADATTDLATSSHSLDSGLVELTLLTSGLIDSCGVLRDLWSKQLSSASAMMEFGNSDFDTYLQAVLSVIVRITEQLDEMFVDRTGSSWELPEFPPTLSHLVDALGDDTDEATSQIDSVALMTVVQDAVRSVESLRTATLQDSEGRSFWDDGAFHSLILHMDYLQQTLLQQLEERTKPAGRRRSLEVGARIDPTEGRARLAITIKHQPLATHYARLTRASQLSGDYLAAIFHGRNYLRLVAEEPGGLAARAQRAGADESETEAIDALAEAIEQFVTAPSYDLSTIAVLATTADHIVDLLRAAHEAEAE